VEESRKKGNLRSWGIYRELPYKVTDLHIHNSRIRPRGALKRSRGYCPGALRADASAGPLPGLASVCHKSKRRPKAPLPGLLRMRVVRRALRARLSGPSRHQDQSGIPRRSPRPNQTPCNRFWRGCRQWWWALFPERRETHR
jgi:hypothetical protein